MYYDTPPTVYSKLPEGAAALVMGVSLCDPLYAVITHEQLQRIQDLWFHVRALQDCAPSNETIEITVSVPGYRLVCTAAPRFRVARDLQIRITAKHIQMGGEGYEGWENFYFDYRDGSPYLTPEQEEQPEWRVRAGHLLPEDIHGVMAVHLYYPHQVPTYEALLKLELKESE